MSDDEKMLLKHFNDVLATYPKEELEKKLKNFEQFKQILPDYEGYLDKSFYAKNPYTNEMYSDEDFKKFTDAIDNVKNQKIKEAAIQKLPLDEASRMARAKAMGFDTNKIYYHGTPHGDVNEFNKNSFFSPDSDFASMYSRSHQLPDPTIKATVHPTYLKTKNFFDFENAEHLEKLKKTLIEKYKTSNIPAGLQEKTLSGFEDPASFSPEKRANNIINILNNLNKNKEANWSLLENNEINDAIKKSGFDGTFLTESGRKNVMVFDPKNIRSKFADFDPAKSDSSDISSFVESKPKSSVLGKAFKLADIYQAGSDISKGDIVNPAISAAEAAAPKLGAVASRGAPLLDLLRPTEMMTEEQAIEDEMRKPEQYRNFKKLKKLFSEE